VSADCACAGGAASNANDTAKARQAGESVLSRLIIKVLPILLFWVVDINPGPRRIFRLRDIEIAAQEKRRRGTNRSAFALYQPAKSVGLLDRRKFPASAALPSKGPDFGHLDRRVAAGDQTIGAAFQR